LRHAFGGAVAVDGIDLDVAEGRSSACSPERRRQDHHDPAHHTLLPAGPGMVQVFGRDVSSHRMASAGRSLPAAATLRRRRADGRENVELFARLFDVPRSQRRERVREVLTAMGLADAAERRAQTYSGGMIRRLELARR